MRVFMLGWEFPPYISGGLGTACYGLTKALSAQGVDIIFVLPRPTPELSEGPPLPGEAPPYIPPPAPPTSGPSSTSPFSQKAPPVKSVRPPRDFEHVTFRSATVRLLDPYTSAEVFETTFHRELTCLPHSAADVAETPLSEDSQSAVSSTVVSESIAPAAPASRPRQTPPPARPPAEPYSGDLFSEVQRYAELSREIAEKEEFDVVHAHDWMTFPAAMAVAAMRGVPIILHVHSTEFDRSGDNPDPRIVEIERRGMHAALKIIAVSFLTRNQIIRQYHINPPKIEVVYNAIEQLPDAPPQEERYEIRRDEKVVLFLGRLTHQKGPEYFLQAAKKVLEVMPNVKFVMAGSGDLARQSVDAAARLGIGHSVLFTGFLRGRDVEAVFKLADLYVMPSVSEPFGIAPLEAMSHDVPVLISRQSGVSEVLRHVLKVDFWDVDEMANKIIAVLKHPPLARELREQGSLEVRRFSWTAAAEACEEIYEQAVTMMGLPGVKPHLPETDSVTAPTGDK